MNKQTMTKMLELSMGAYNDIQPVCSSDRAELIKSRVTDTECFLRIDGKNIIITFRGTDSKINWLSNFCFAKKTIPYGNSESNIRVHCGFLENYKSIRSNIHKLIPDDSCKIIVTGHSMGAALAVLCAVDLQYNFIHHDIEVYLFGCPRVGNAAFAKSYNKRIFKTLRVSCGNDIVTKLPPAIFGYRHVGIDIHIGKLRMPYIISLKQHSPRKYYGNLWRINNLLF